MMSILSVYKTMALAFEKRYNNDINQLIWVALATSVTWAAFHYLLTNTI